MSGKSIALNVAASSTIAQTLVRHSAELDEMLGQLQPGLNVAEFHVARTIVGKIMGEIYLAALYPIFETYPDLKPPGFP